MHALIAFDKFKDAIDAPSACAAAASGLRIAQPAWELDLCPLADGGEGFSSILTHAAHGELRAVTVMGPLEQQSAHYGLVRWRNVPEPARPFLLQGNRARAWDPDDLIAVVEMAVASGLAQVPPNRRNPWKTTSLGTGQLLRFAAEAGAKVIVVGVGGSATNDLGLGSMAALGWEFFDVGGDRVVSPTPETWTRIARVTAPKSSVLPPVAIACDVENPLLGPRGATATYGPQKGLTPRDVPILDQAMAAMAQRVSAAAGKPAQIAEEPGTGAAGGIVFGLRCAADAWIVPGFDLVQAWLDIDRRMARADIVLTGEGRFDATSLTGKGPGALARRAVALGKRAHIFAGSLGVDSLPAGMTAQAISPKGMPLADALKATATLLTKTVEATARAW